MCTTCKEAKKYKPGDESVENTDLRQKLLGEIAEQMKKGVAPGHFDAVLARLSDKELKERDEEIEGRWENTYRALRAE